MKKTCTIVLGLAETLKKAEGDLIGADRGAWLCVKNKRRMKAAVGDFDSVDEPQLAEIQEWADDLVRLPVMKDETDTLSAVHYAEKLGYERIILIGGCGGRLDHQYANQLLVMYGTSDLEIREENNQMRCLNPGEYRFMPNEYRFISFFAVEPSVITLRGFLYPLDQYAMNPGDTIGISNEIPGEEAWMTLDQGRIAVIRSNDEQPD